MMKLRQFYVWLFVVALLCLPTAAILSFFAPIQFQTATIGLVVNGAVYSACAAIVCMPIAAAIERGKSPRLMISGLIAAKAAVVFWIIVFAIAAIANESVPNWSIIAGTVSSVWAGLIAVISALVVLPLHRPAMRYLRLATIVMTTLLALHVVGTVSYLVTAQDELSYQDVDVFLQTALRIGGIVAIPAFAGLLATAICARLPELGIAEVSHGDLGQVTLICPRCMNQGELSFGGDTCPECGLLITITPA